MTVVGQGSNFMSSLYSLEGAYGAVQVLALVLGSVGEQIIPSIKRVAVPELIVSRGPVPTATLGNSEKINEGWRTLFLLKM